MLTVSSVVCSVAMAGPAMADVSSFENITITTTAKPAAAVPGAKVDSTIRFEFSAPVPSGVRVEIPRGSAGASGIKAPVGWGCTSADPAVCTPTTPLNSGAAAEFQVSAMMPDDAEVNEQVLAPPFTVYASGKPSVRGVAVTALPTVPVAPVPMFEWGAAAFAVVGFGGALLFRRLARRGRALRQPDPFGWMHPPTT